MSKCKRLEIVFLTAMSRLRFNCFTRKLSQNDPFVNILVINGELFSKITDSFKKVDFLFHVNVACDKFVALLPYSIYRR